MKDFNASGQGLHGSDLSALPRVLTSACAANQTLPAPRFGLDDAQEAWDKKDVYGHHRFVLVDRAHAGRIWPTLHRRDAVAIVVSGPNEAERIARALRKKDTLVGTGRSREIWYADTTFQNKWTDPLNHEQMQARQWTLERSARARSGPGPQVTPPAI